MTIASSHTLNWSPPGAQQSFEPVDTPSIPQDSCYPLPEEYLAIHPSPGPKEYAELIEKQNREYELLGEKLLLDVVDSIRRLVPLEVDGETQKLLDAAIEHQETGPCDDVEGWASRLAADVKDADD